MFLRLCCFFLAFLWPSALFSQAAFYPFAVDQDSLSGAVDFSRLNTPLGPQDRVFARSGHFYRVGPDLLPDTVDDRPIRFFGVNLCFGANFPEPADAERLARRLQKLGVNLVRLHHMDSQPDTRPENAGSLLTTGPYPSVNATSASRMRSFLRAFSACGIHVNLNLHVGYTFRPDVDRIPALPAPLEFPKQSKPLHVFYPRMVELQAECARLILEALQLGQDPVLAMVEINNESSLIYAWQAGQLAAYCTGEYRLALSESWNDYLRSRYSGTPALQEAWGGSLPAGNPLLPGKWQLEIHSPSRAAMETLTWEGEPAARVTVTAGGAPVILKQVGFSVTAGTGYRAEVEIRADLPAGTVRSIYWDVKQDVSPWQTSIGKNIDVTSEWKKFEIAWTPSFSMTGIGRFGLSVEKVDGPAWFRRWDLRTAPIRGLSDEESLEAGNVALVNESEASTPRRTEDYQRFLIEKDRQYLEQIRAAVRQAADPLVPVTGTQMGYGGLANLDSHGRLDYLDNHFYVDHYNFPNVSWDGRDWRIRDSSVVESGLTAYLNMAVTRRSDQPFTVSEYNQPWPNTRGAEIDPTLAAFASFQDWDGVLHFAYAHSRNWETGVPNGFNLNGDWGKFVNFGQSAWIFRTGAIDRGASPLLLPVSDAQRQQATRERRNGSIGAFLTASQGWEANQALLHPVGLLLSDTAPFPAEARRKPTAPYRADQGPWTFDPDRKLFLLHSSRVSGVFGRLEQNSPVIAGVLGVESVQTRNNAAFLLTPLDGKELRSSSRLLLSMPGYVLRTQSQSSPPRPQALVGYLTAADWWTIERDPEYPQKPSGNLNDGTSPAWMERVEARITLELRAESLTVFPLSGSGQRLSPIAPGDIESEGSRFRVHLQKEGQAFSPWYEIQLKKPAPRRLLGYDPQ